MEWGIVGALIVGAVLLFVSVYDAKTRLIPNEAVVLLVVIRIAVPWSEVGLIKPGALPISIIQAVVVVVGLVVLALIMEKIIGGPSFGMGDIKLIGALVLFFQAGQILSFLWLMCFAMVVSAFIYALKKRKTFPCAPAISYAFAAEVLFDFGLW